MSDRLPQHELELMSLFDRDLDQQERTRLIELLSEYPDLSEKYAFYLHLQDLDLTEMPEPDPSIRRHLLKMATIQTRKVRFAAKLQAVTEWLTQPFVAAPAALCLVFLVGYELLDSNISNEQPVVFMSSEETPLHKEQFQHLQEEEQQEPNIPKLPSQGKNKSRPSTLEGHAKQSGKKMHSMENLLLNSKKASESTQLGKASGKNRGLGKVMSSKSNQVVKSPAKRNSEQPGGSAGQPASNVSSLKARENRKRRVDNLFGGAVEDVPMQETIDGAKTHALNDILIGSTLGKGNVDHRGSGSGGGGMSARSSSARLGSARATRKANGRKRAKKRVSPERTANATKPSIRKHRKSVNSQAIRPDTQDKEAKDPEELAVMSDEASIIEPSLDAVQPAQSPRTIESERSAMARINPRALDKPLTKQEQQTLLDAKAKINLQADDSVMILRLARLAIRAKDLTQASTWTEWVIRRNDDHLQDALELRRKLKQLRDK